LRAGQKPGPARKGKGHPPQKTEFELLKDKLHDAQERDGHYLLRGFGAGDEAAPLWERREGVSRKEMMRALWGVHPIAEGQASSLICLRNAEKRK